MSDQKSERPRALRRGISLTRAILGHYSSSYGFAGLVIWGYVEPQHAHVRAPLYPPDNRLLKDAGQPQGRGSAAFPYYNLVRIRRTLRMPQAMAVGVRIACGPFRNWLRKLPANNQRTKEMLWQTRH